MGNSLTNQTDKKKTEIIPVNIQDINSESKYFRQFSYLKGYVETEHYDQFYEYLDVKSQNFLSKLDSESLDNICEILLSIPNLKGLKLPLRNQKEMGNIQKINQVLLKLKSLIVLELNLQFSKLSDDDIAHFLDSFQNMVNIIDLHLNLSFTSFGNKSMTSLCNLLSKMKNLNELGLELECIPLKGSEFFPLLSKIKSLKDLCDFSLLINDSDIGDEGLIILSDSLKSIDNISGLELRVNKNITMEGFNYFLNVLISKPDQLITLKLFFNLNAIKNICTMTKVLKSQKYLSELQWSFTGTLDGPWLSQIINVDELVQIFEKSLYLFQVMLVPQILTSTVFNKINQKAKIIPILQTITSNLRRRKYRKEIIEELVQMITPFKT